MGYSISKERSARALANFSAAQPAILATTAAECPQDPAGVNCAVKYGARGVTGRRWKTPKVVPSDVWRFRASWWNSAILKTCRKRLLLIHDGHGETMSVWPASLRTTARLTACDWVITLRRRRATRIGGRVIDELFIRGAEVFYDRYSTPRLRYAHWKN